MATLGMAKDSLMDTRDQFEQADGEEPASIAESQRMSDTGLAQEHESLHNSGETRTPPSNTEVDTAPGPATQKPTFMRVAREHISSEVLTKHSIPYIDDSVRILAIYKSVPAADTFRIPTFYSLHNGFQNLN
jgi:hypothetical protein